MEKAVSWVSDTFDQIEQSANGLGKSAFHELRKKAFEAFQKSGLPTPKLEEWKYTNIRDLNQLALSAPRENSSSVSMADVEPFLISGLDCYRLVFVDGFFNRALSSSENLEGLHFATIHDVASGTHESLSNAFSAYFASQFSLDEDSMVSLNTAFVQDGAVLSIVPNTKIEKPIHLVYLSSRSEGPQASYPRLLLLAERGSECSVIETFASQENGDLQGGLTSYLGEIFVEENASVHHLKIGLESEAQYHLGRHGVVQKRDSRFSTTAISFGGKIVRNEVCPVLQGENTRTVMNGLSVLNGEQHVDNNTVLDHAVPNCESEELYKGVYADKSKGVFSGTIIVREGAQKTNAIQNNQGLLLSDTASLHTKPQLKIWADDVKCTHGATIGQLDQEALFYIRSRGVGELDAKKLLVKAFAGEVFQGIEIAEVREYIDSLTDQKLGQVTAQHTPRQ